MKRFKGIITSGILVLGDTAAILGSFLLGYLVRGGLGVLVGGAGSFAGGVASETLLQRVYFLLLYPFVFAYEGLYTKRLTDWEERRRCFRGVVVGTALLTILLFMTRIWIVSRFVVFLAAIFSVVFVSLFRAVLKRLLVKVGLFSQPLVVLGEASGRRFLEEELKKHRTLGYSIVRHIFRTDTREDVISNLAKAEIPAGALIVVFSESFTPEELKAIFQYAEERFAELMVVPSAVMLATSTTEIEQVGGILVLKYHYNLLRPLNIWTKSVIEFAVSFVLLILLLPLIGLLAILIKLSSPGPVFFRQPRVGKGGKIFTCFKFRTMYQDAATRLEEILNSAPEKRREFETTGKLKSDPRVTSIGRFLRRFSFDELPQLFNVLRGDMALVGPRPYLPAELVRVANSIRTIVRVRPGLTGLWQVSGRGDLTFQERMVLDEYYIRNWSLWLDFSILVRTIKAVLTGRGAY